MATPVVMPKLGNSVESSIIVEWKKAVGESVQAGEVLCEVETDKAIVEVESPVTGTVLAHFFAAGSDVPVRTPIAVVGSVGEAFDDLRPQDPDSAGSRPAMEGEPLAASEQAALTAPSLHSMDPAPVREAAQPDRPAPPRVSPRARRLAAQHEIDLARVTGSGPEGRIIERDVETIIETQPRVSPVARAMLDDGDFVAPALGSGPRGRIMSHDLQPRTQDERLIAETTVGVPGPEDSDGAVREIPLKGVRRVIANRMLASVQETAQLTLTSGADATALLRLRTRLKQSVESLQLRAVTINDLLLFAVSRTLPQFPALNAHFDGNTISQFDRVHLGFAVDTDRGLLVPVLRDAQLRSLRSLSQDSRRLADAARSGTIGPDDLTGGTFTATNLGHLGIESFTPILNPPQVAILGIGALQLRPVAAPQGTEESQLPLRVRGDVRLAGDAVQFVQHLGLSLTINHQVVDGAPAARFLQALTQAVTDIDLLLAL